MTSIPRFTVADIHRFLPDDPEVFVLAVDAEAYTEQIGAACHRLAVGDCIAVIQDYITETQKHVGANECWPEKGDRCDITAALKTVIRLLEEGCGADA